MTVTINPVEYVTAVSVLLTWSSDLVDQVYSVYVDNKLVVESPAESYLLTVETGASPVIEIIDDGSVPGLFWPQKLLLSWRSVQETEQYRIEKLNGSWSVVGIVTNGNAGHYSWLTGVLEDGVEYQYRIVPEGVNGNDGDPLTFVVTMVRNPSPPAATWSYDDGTGVVTATVN